MRHWAYCPGLCGLDGRVLCWQLTCAGHQPPCSSHSPTLLLVSPSSFPDSLFPPCLVAQKLKIPFSLLRRTRQLRAWLLRVVGGTFLFRDYWVRRLLQTRENVGAAECEQVRAQPPPHPITHPDLRVGSCDEGVQQVVAVWPRLCRSPGHGSVCPKALGMVFPDWRWTPQMGAPSSSVRMNSAFFPCWFWDSSGGKLSADHESSSAPP